MKWKKLTALAMASMMIATILSGCGGGNSEEKSSGKTAESSSEAKPDEKQELVLNNVDCKVLDVNDARICSFESCPGRVIPCIQRQRWK